MEKRKKKKDDNQEQKQERIGLQLYTVKEVAELLRVHPVTVRTWIREGKLKSIQLKSQGPGKYRIEQQEIERILKNAI